MISLQKSQALSRKQGFEIISKWFVNSLVDNLSVGKCGKSSVKCKIIQVHISRLAWSDMGHGQG